MNSQTSATQSVSVSHLPDSKKRTQRPPRSTAGGEAEEEILLRRAMFGHVPSFEVLMGMHRQCMYRSALRVTESHEDAEEAFQEASLSAYRKLKQFQGESQLRTWLIRIAINHALMIRRKRKGDRVVPLIFESADGESAYDPADLRPNPEQSCYRREMDRKLRMAIERLSPTLRSAFVLRHVDELTPSQAAAALG